MIDIETLGTKPNSIILTIGAQMFDPTSPHEWETHNQIDAATKVSVAPHLNISIDVDEQYAMGRVDDEVTINWWAHQSPQAQQEALSVENRSSVRSALTQLALMATQCKRVWSKGPTFDMVLLEDLYTQTDIALPWKFWNVMDARTVYKLCPALDTKKTGPISHRALDDCRQQIKLLREAFTILGVKHLK